nr:hypothetical protein [Tanacetum cinerariifolium]
MITPFHDDPDILVRQVYTPVATDTESEPFEDPIETDETQPLSPRTAPLSPDYTLTFLGYTLDTPHSNEESDPIEASETRIASPSDSTSPLLRYAFMLHNCPPLYSGTATGFFQKPTSSPT